MLRVPLGICIAFAYLHCKGGLILSILAAYVPGNLKSH